MKIIIHVKSLLSYTCFRRKLFQVLRTVYVKYENVITQNKDNIVFFKDVKYKIMIFIGSMQNSSFDIKLCRIVCYTNKTIS